MAAHPRALIAVPLTEKQRLAVEAHAAGASKKEACRIAGYKDDTEGSRVFDNPNVVRELEKVRALARKELSLEIKDVVAGFMDAVNASSNAMELVAAWREIGKIIGAYEHAKTLNVNVKSNADQIKHVKQLERMSDEDLSILADMGEDFTITDAVYEELANED